MTHAPLGEIFVQLGLLSTEGVEAVLQRMKDGGSGSGLRFGEVALELGLVDDVGLARALAQQFRLNMVPPDRLDKLAVTPEVIALLPRKLMRERLMVPTFLDPEKRVLSLLTVDPTDLPGLRQAQSAAEASRLRLFVAPRSAMVALVDRLLPRTREDTDIGAQVIVPDREIGDDGLAVVVEPDHEVAGAMRRLDALEGGNAEVLHDPEQVASFLDPDVPARLYYRRSLARVMDPYLSAWRRTCPQLTISPVDGFGPSALSAVAWDRARDFFVGLLEFVLLAGENHQMDARSRVRRTSHLARAVAAELELPREQQDAVAVAALFADLDELSLVSGMLDERDEGKRFALAQTVMRQFDPPWDITGLFDAVERRVQGQEGPGRNPAAEVLYTVRAAVRAGIVDGGDPVQAFGAEATRHDAGTLRAMAKVLRKQGLQHQVAAGGGGSNTIVVAEREAAVLTALEAKLGQAAFNVVVASDGAQALELAQNLSPAAIIANQRMPRKDGFSMLLELRRDDATRHIPVLLLTDAGHPHDITRGIELGAEDVIEKPINPNVVLAKLRKALSRRPTANSGITGQLAELPLPDLLQTLTLGGKTALVQLTQVEEAGGVQVRDGHIVAAQHGGRVGEEALYSLCCLDHGRFEVRFEDSGATNVHGPSEFLLLEALRRRDEARHAAVAHP